MSGKSIKFDDKKIKKSSFNKNKKISKIDDINANNGVVKCISCL